MNTAQQKMGRPSKYTPQIAEEICGRLSKGEPLAVICRDEGMPVRQVIYNWAEKDEEFNGRIARARDEGYDAIAYRLRDTARGSGDSSGEVQRDKLIVETDLKLLSKWAPKRYGEKIDIEHSGNLDIKVTIGGSTS